MLEGQLCRTIGRDTERARRGLAPSRTGCKREEIQCLETDCNTAWRTCQGISRIKRDTPTCTPHAVPYCAAIGRSWLQYQPRHNTRSSSIAVFALHTGSRVVTWEARSELAGLQHFVHAPLVSPPSALPRCRGLVVEG